MALNTKVVATDQAPPVVADAANQGQQANETVLLELSMYTHYTWQNQTYEGGQAYRFSRETAMQLLGDLDHGRPIWRMHRAPRPKQQPKNLVIDATDVTAVRTREHLDGGVNPAKRIDVGTDEEIADVLNRGEGDVTL